MANYDIYRPEFMLAVIREKKPLFTFFKDRYFQPDAASVFKTEKVLVDYEDGAGSILAPFVLPTLGAEPMTRDGYETRELTPPYIAISMPLTAYDLQLRQAGESIVSTLTPEQREQAQLVRDMEALDKAITRREEWMCVQTMLDNACTMKHIGDNGDKGKDLIARYYDGNKNPGVFKPTTAWAGSSDEHTPGSWYKGVCAQLRDMRAAGRNATDLVVGANIADMILEDKWAWKRLDIRRSELGELDPRWQENGVTRIGKLNFGGHDLEIFSYEGTYEERDPKTRILTTKSYFPADGALLAAPKTGKLAYGAVTQMEKDEKFHTRTGTRVPKYDADVKHNTKEAMLTSRPIAIPTVKSPWRACRNVKSTT